MRRRTLLAAGGVLALAACGRDLDRDGGRSVSRGPSRVPYGEDPSQFAELTLPDGDPKGVVVVIHGGFWKAMYDLEYGRPLAADLARRGWAAWNLEYRRVGNGGGVPHTLDDVAAGIDALAEQDLDLTHVLALGHSAGGHLAVWAGSRGASSRWQAQVPLTGIVSQAGVVDLVAAYDAGLGSGAVEAFLGHPPSGGDRDVDPIQQVPLDVPVRCVHGRDDDVVPLSQSQAYVAAARRAGAEAHLDAVDGDHFSVIETGGDAWARTVAILDGMVDGS